MGALGWVLVGFAGAFVAMLILIAWTCLAVILVLIGPAPRRAGWRDGPDKPIGHEGGAK